MKTEELHLQSAIHTYQSTQSQDRLMTSTEVANILRVSSQSLKMWRKNGTGPPWIKVNQTTVRYSQNSLYKWLNCDCKPLHSLKPIDQPESVS